MLAVSALEYNPKISDQEIENALCSNLCRCTGYGNIVKAVRAVARVAAEAPMCRQVEDAAGGEPRS